MNQTSTQASCSDSDSDSSHSGRRSSISERRRQVSSGRPNRHISRRRRDSLSRDDDSSRLYFSEPSGTENGDASSGVIRYDPSSAAVLDNHLRSPTETNAERRGEPRMAASPENTSLSSRDMASPAGAKSVVFQFTPDRRLPSSVLLDEVRRGVQGIGPLERSSNYQSRQSSSMESPQNHRGLTLKPTPPDQPTRTFYTNWGLSPKQNSSTGSNHTPPSLRVIGTQQDQSSIAEQDVKLVSNTIINQELSAQEGSINHASDSSDDAWSSSLAGKPKNNAAGLPAYPPMDTSIAMTLSDDSEPQDVPHAFLTSLSAQVLQKSNMDQSGILSSRSKRRVVPTVSRHKRSRRRGTGIDAVDSVDVANDLTKPMFSNPRGGTVDARIYDGSCSTSTDYPVFGPVIGPAGLSTPHWPETSTDVLQRSRPRRQYASPSANTNIQRLPTLRTDVLANHTTKGLEGHHNFIHKTPVFVDGTRDDNEARLPERIPFLEQNPFENITKGSAEKVSRQFIPLSSMIDDNESNNRFFTCPRCKTRQREFITVSSAPSQDSGPSGYLALYFALYVTASLFIFGLEEGWKPLDCIYFAVITLTTCGLGDFVPTTPGNKLICSFFIYFGVACIGLLLGTYIAGILDDKASRDRKSKQMESCPNCKQLQNIKDAASGRFSRVRSAGRRRDNIRSSSESRGIASLDVYRPRANTPVGGSSVSHPRHSLLETDVASPSVTSGKQVPTNSPEPNHAVMTDPSPYLLSPVTRRILGRQGHTRHVSIDLTTAPTSRLRRENFSKLNSHIVSETSPLKPPALSSSSTAKRAEDSTSDDDSDASATDSECSDSSASTKFDIMDDNTFRIRAAKYVILTIRQALLNSIVIIALGCFGFWFIEGFPVIDSWYFTTVLLTTTGYGDITPYTKGGKLFATVYILVAGTILLNNMSMISIIPLELRRRRIERAVLTQFGDELDDEALRELATGPLVQRLHLTARRPDGLDECTREMFSLAMLVRLGKVTEEDIKETFAAFRRLDVNDEGVLNSKSIIAAMIHRRRARNDSNRKEASLKLPKSTSAPTLYVEPNERTSFEVSSFAGEEHAWVHSGGYYSRDASMPGAAVPYSRTRT